MRSFSISGYLKKDENGYYTTKNFKIERIEFNTEKEIIQYLKKQK